VYMDLVQQAHAVESIRETLADKVGQTLRVRANMGRSKIVEDEGTLLQVHPQLFILEVNRKRGRKVRQSYQYADILTGTVELSQDGAMIFSPFNFDEEEPEPVVNMDYEGEELEEERILL